MLSRLVTAVRSGQRPYRRAGQAGLLVLACLWAAGALAEDASSAGRISDAVQPFVDAGHLSGTLLVARNDELLFERTWGEARPGVPFTEKTPSLTASVSKPMTVVIAARLLDAGTLSLRDPIAKWLPDFPRGEDIEVQHLLFHRSGIAHRLVDAAAERQWHSTSDLVEAAAALPLDFEPGTQRSYSSGGFSVLVRVLELASGKSFTQLFDEHFIEPLDLEQTSLSGATRSSLQGDAADTEARSWHWTLDGPVALPPKHYSFLVGAGSVASTPRELWRVARHLVDDGFGQRARRLLLRRGQLRWNGATDGYRAFVDYDQETGIWAVLVSNLTTGAHDWIRRNIALAVRGEPVGVAVVPQVTPERVPTEVLARYEGMYQIGGRPMPIRARDGALFANDWLLVPTGADAFYSPQDYSRLRFLPSESGDVLTGVDWGGAVFPRLGDLGSAEVPTAVE